MASNTYTAIATVTVGSGGAANIEFTSIPGTYTDLSVVISGRSANTGKVDAIYARFNSSSTGYTNRILYGETTGTGSFSPSLSYAHCGYTSGGTTTSSTFSNVNIYLPNYTSSNNKSISVDSVTEDNASTYQSGVQSLQAALWSNSAAITSIVFTTESTSNFAQYSSATLYGIKNS